MPGENADIHTRVLLKNSMEWLGKVPLLIENMAKANLALRVLSPAFDPASGHAYECNGEYLERDTHCLRKYTRVTSDTAPPLRFLFAVEHRGSRRHAINMHSRLFVSLRPRGFTAELMYASQASDHDLDNAQYLEHFIESVIPRQLFNFAAGYLMERDISLVKGQTSLLAVYEAVQSPGMLTVSLRDVDCLPQEDITVVPNKKYAPVSARLCITITNRCSSRTLQLENVLSLQPFDPEALPSSLAPGDSFQAEFSFLRPGHQAVAIRCALDDNADRKLDIFTGVQLQHNKTLQRTVIEYTRDYSAETPIHLAASTDITAVNDDNSDHPTTTDGASLLASESSTAVALQTTYTRGVQDKSANGTTGCAMSSKEDEAALWAHIKHLRSRQDRNLAEVHICLLDDEDQPATLISTCLCFRPPYVMTSSGITPESISDQRYHVQPPATKTLYVSTEENGNERPTLAETDQQEHAKVDSKLTSTAVTSDDATARDASQVETEASELRKTTTIQHDTNAFPAAVLHKKRVPAAPASLFPDNGIDYAALAEEGCSWFLFKELEVPKANQTTPMTLDLFCQIPLAMNMADALDAYFWTVCLFSFFGLYAKHDLPSKTSSLDPQLPGTDVHIHHPHLLMRKRTKMHGKFTQTPIYLEAIQGSILCPYRALERWLLHNNRNDKLLDGATMPLSAALVKRNADWLDKQLASVLARAGIRWQHGMTSIRIGGAHQATISMLENSEKSQEVDQISSMADVFRSAANDLGMVAKQMHQAMLALENIGIAKAQQAAPNARGQQHVGVDKGKAPKETADMTGSLSCSSSPSSADIDDWYAIRSTQTDDACPPVGNPSGTTKVDTGRVAPPPSASTVNQSTASTTARLKEAADPRLSPVAPVSIATTASTPSNSSSSSSSTPNKTMPTSEPCTEAHWPRDVVAGLFIDCLPMGVPFQQPAAPEMLLCIRDVMNLKQESDARIWMMILLAYYGMMSATSIVRARLCKPKMAGDGTLMGSAIIAPVSLSSLELDQGYIFQLPVLQNHRLCPMRALRAWLKFRVNTANPLHDGMCIFDVKKDTKGVRSAKERLKRNIQSVAKQLALPGELGLVTFRYGGALCALEEGCSPDEVCRAGCWPKWKKPIKQTRQVAREPVASIARYVDRATQYCRKP
ncbi:hypothetical protein THASP1DRAFT_26417 [Thamnocephalis sphaerospora]|uniref:Uncharacterized protein n=1 Tax=Thamnocephalis sphaerospora TaxID=78915 RepID=A0A4P9XHC1_9FUNG|nr:hypothetical protein THASP1DRAFT_26417 [Thamnocephalis sphaerospora]|eukprot:RKP05028.1 hypothetical protein THASP1DRAFT_26417 [Thamnocephalis sphaerospora]